MSKIAEEAALKAYPSDIYSGGKSCRRAYKEGYEQAEKETIELAQLWVDSGDANVMSFEQFLKRKSCCKEIQ